MSKKKIISIVGPTASGKSDLAFKIAEKYNKSNDTEGKKNFSRINIK